MSYNPYQPPSSELCTATNAPSPAYANFALARRWKRLAGSFLDGVLVMIATVPALYFTGYLSRVEAQSVSLPEAIAWQVAGFAVIVAINGYTLHTRGQSIGKLALGTRIVSEESRELVPLWHIVLRRYLPVSVATMVPLVGNLAAIADALFVFRKDRRCVHDLVAGTVVIDANVRETGEQVHPIILSDETLVIPQSGGLRKQISLRGVEGVRMGDQHENHFGLTLEVSDGTAAQHFLQVPREHRTEIVTLVEQHLARRRRDGQTTG